MRPPLSIGAMLRRDIHPSDELSGAVRLARSFDELWVVEDLSWAGGVGQLAAVLGATDDVIVGHGLAPAPFRNPAALAMEWATVAAMHPGRVRAAIGHGVPHWMASVGEAVESPLTLLRETLEATTTLLAGRRLRASGRYVTIDDLELVFPPRPVPPVYVGALGPRSLRLSGELAAGTVLPEGQGPDEIARALTLIAEGAERRTEPADHHLTVFVGFHLGTPDELAPRNPDAPVGFEVVTDDVAVAVRSLRSVVDAGADSVVLVPMGPDPIEGLERAGAEVVSAVRSA